MRLAALVAMLAAPAGEPLFRDIAAHAGISWRHFNGESPDRFLVESTTGGVAFLDFDHDGLQDLLLVNGGETPRGRSKQPVRHALYRNTGNLRFQDVTARSGLGSTAFYGMGAAAADFDNDGDTDLYLSGYPSGALYRNDAGRFVDITESAGASNRGEWGTSAAWFDFDNDGRLDLFVANYAEFSFDAPIRCDFEGKPTYCAQTAYRGRPSRLYRNEGDGRFTDISTAAGVAALQGRALGVVAVDYDGDGRQDLFVARDASPNLLLRNRGGSFEDKALEAETAYDTDGVARAGMGVDAGDIDGDGLPDFVVTNFDGEFHALYRNPGRLPFQEITTPSGLAAATKPYVGWGVRMLDHDNDGDLDLLLVNGHLQEMISRSNTSVAYREPPLLLANDGRGRLSRIDAGPVFRTGYLGRGLASADLDNDGAIDAAFVSLNDPPVVLRNRGAANRWLGVRLKGTTSNRDAIGAKLALRVGERTLTRWAVGGGSFLGSHDRRVIFGLGPAGSPGVLEIQWPSGIRQRVDGLAPGRYHEIEEPRAP